MRMLPRVSITRVQFRNFKAFQNFSLHLDSMNVLVGPNNAGKSTIVGAFRVLAAGLQKAHARSPERVMGPEGMRSGYSIARDTMPISVENVHTNYADTDTTATFHLSNEASLTVYFNSSGDCVMFFDHLGGPIRGPAAFKKAFPIGVSAVPVLAPLEHEEPLVRDVTVQRNLATHRASRNFRNYWLKNQDQFQHFQDLITETWPGMDVLAPEVVTSQDPYVSMFCIEGPERMQRELFWVGSGFQIWCQLVTHLIRAEGASLVVIDEPEIYLHPQLQRALLAILRDLGPDVLLATHSSDMIQEADPSDIVLIESFRQSGKRVTGDTATREALGLVGSARNDVLTSAARTRRIAFVEGEEFKMVRQFAECAGMRGLARTSNITPLPLGGFLPPQQILAIVRGISEALGALVQFAVILDRDYRSDEEINRITTVLSRRIPLVHVHSRKEIENYLLVPSAIDRAVDTALEEQRRRGMAYAKRSKNTEDIIDVLTESDKSEIQGNYIGRRVDYARREGHRADTGQISAETIEWFGDRWSRLDTRLAIVPGKRVMSRLNSRLQQDYGLSLTPRKIIASMRPEELDDDLMDLLRALDHMAR